MAGVKDPKAYMAAIERKRFGKEKMTEMASRGRGRAAKARKVGRTHKRTYDEGGGATFEAGVRFIRSGKRKKIGQLLGAKSPAARARVGRSA